MFKFKKTLTFLGLSALGAMPLSTISCGTDDFYSIGYTWANEGFIGTQKEKDFLNLLEQKYNNLRKSNEKYKNLKDKKFKFIQYEDKTALLSDLVANKYSKVDVATLQYTAFAQQVYENYFKNSPQEFLPLIAQTKTMKFIWQGDDKDLYSTGLEDDKLIQSAKRENEEQFIKYGEYPTWKDDPKGKWSFDGSKYKVFYNTNEFTSVYRGTILISGDKATRDEIIDAWNKKDWDKFLSYGITYKKNSSGGGFKYQLSLLAQHFAKPIADLKNDLLDSKKATFGKATGKVIGKKTEKGKINHIGFDDEGVFNWTPKSWGEDLFKPAGFSEEKSQDENDVVRVLTQTNPAPYDALLGRKGLEEVEKEILSEIFASLSYEENTFGIYTGYNQFRKITDAQYKEFIKLQLATEGYKTDDPALSYEKIDIPEIK